MRASTSKESRFRQIIAFGFAERRSLILACLSLLFVLLAATWLIVNNSQQKLIEFKSRQIANVVASQAKTARSLYSRSVVAKLGRDGFSASTESDGQLGSVPIPAQFLKQLAHDSAEKNQKKFQFRPLSKWNLSPAQGLRDEFQRWAWEQLELQASNQHADVVSWEPVWRIESVEGRDALRYLVADPATSSSCVECHNALETTPAIRALRSESGVETGKVWQLNDLMGALEVIVPLHESSTLAAAQTKAGLLFVLVVAITGILLVLGVSILDGARSLSLAQSYEILARNDSLTNLPNRAGFEFKVKSLMEENQAQNNHAVMLLDLNDFKQINDTLGHHVGDDVLKEVAKRFQNVISDPAVIARLGGDEFVIFLPNVDNDDLHSVAQNIGIALFSNLEIGEFRMRASTSIGIARSPENGKELHELLRCADVAMYCAKRAKTGYEFYDSANDHNHINALSIISDFKTALDTDGLHMVYQPKLDLETGTVCGIEALLRWYHPEHGVISPVRLVPMAEQSDQIAALTRWTLNTGLAQLKRWHKSGYDLKLAINLSAQMLNTDEAVEMILELLSVHDVCSDRLIVEVTETAVMRNPEKAVKLLKWLKKAGVILSLDDFGTGYSSLSHVHRLPVHELKLDKSFMENLNYPKNRAIVKTAIELAENLDLELVAEGVEDAKTLALLLDLNCTRVQGFFLCKPLTAELLTGQFDDLYKLAGEWRDLHHSSRISRAA